MAQNENIFTRLGKLFSSQIVVRQTPDGNVKVKDVDFAQTSLTTNFIDRYNRLFNGQNSSWGSAYAAKQNAQNAYDAQRRELFRDYEIMDSDSIISSDIEYTTTENGCWFSIAINLKFSGLKPNASL